MPTNFGSNPTADLQLVQGGGHGDHPVVVLKLNGEVCLLPFTLQPNPNNERTILFVNNLTQGVRIFVMAFSGNFPPDGQQPPSGEVKFRIAMTVGAGDRQTLLLTQGNLSGATKIWVGSWWNDPTYPDDVNGKTAYFNAHPVGGGHHTVPVITG